VLPQNKKPQASLVLSMPAQPQENQTPPEPQVVPEAPAAPEVPVALEVPAVPVSQIALEAPAAPATQGAPEVQKAQKDAEQDEASSLALSTKPVAAQPPLVLLLTSSANAPAPETPRAQGNRQPPVIASGEIAVKRRSKKRARRAILIALRDMVIALALLALLLQFFSPTIVREHSMENTLKENEILYVGQKAYWFGDPKRSDIVVFKSTLTDESGEEKVLVKRIIGLPGDRIAIGGGTVYRNGQALSEPYVKGGVTRGDLSELIVPEDSYFVLGDNRDVSNDSRNAEIGFISKEQLRGKVLLRIFPLSDFHVF
jgi:signal peptidase I